MRVRTNIVRSWMEQKEQKKAAFEEEKQRKHKETFLEGLMISGRVVKACEFAGLGRTTVYRWKNEDTEFREAWIRVKTEAGENKRETLEEAAYIRAIDGVPAFRYDKDGNTIYETTHYSDSLHKLLLQSEDPEKYRDRKDVRHGGKVEHLVYDMGLPSNAP